MSIFGSDIFLEHNIPLSASYSAFYDLSYDHPRHFRGSSGSSNHPSIILLPRDKKHYRVNFSPSPSVSSYGFEDLNQSFKHHPIAVLGFGTAAESRSSSSWVGCSAFYPRQHLLRTWFSNIRTRTCLICRWPGIYEIRAPGETDWMKSDLPEVWFSWNPYIRRHGFYEIQASGGVDFMKSGPADALIS